MSQSNGSGISEFLKVWKDSGVQISGNWEKALGHLVIEAEEPVAQAPLQKSAPSQTGLAWVRSELGDCQRCPRCQTRKNIIFGSGDPAADLVFVGGTPSSADDSQGKTFAGESGKLLIKIIEAMGFTRETVYYTDLLKCFSSVTSEALAQEIEQCGPFLHEQLIAVNPKVIVALGDMAANWLLETDKGVEGLRGKLHSLSWKPETQVMVTYPPNYLLQHPEAKKLVWEDMKIVMGQLEKKSS